MIVLVHELKVEFELNFIQLITFCLQPCWATVSKHPRSKHVDVKYKYVQQNVQEKVVNLEYIRSQNNLADILTKALVTAVFSFRVAQLLTH